MDFLAIDKIFCHGQKKFVQDNLGFVLDKNYFVRAEGRGIRSSIYFVVILAMPQNLKSINISISQVYKPISYLDSVQVQIFFSFIGFREKKNGLIENKAFPKHAAFKIPVLT